LPVSNHSVKPTEAKHLKSSKQCSWNLKKDFTRHTFEILSVATEAFLEQRMNYLCNSKFADTKILKPTFPNSSCTALETKERESPLLTESSSRSNSSHNFFLRKIAKPLLSGTVVLFRPSEI